MKNAKVQYDKAENIKAVTQGAEVLSGSRNYNEYRMTMRQKAVYTLMAGIVIFGVAFVFYRSPVISFFFTPLSLLYPKIKRASLIKAQKRELNIQFKDMLYSLSSSLTAGKSIELAFREVLRDLAVLYPDRDAYIIVETEHIIRRLEMNGTIEAALEDFAARSHVEDIKSFSEVFSICKRSGGNLVEVIKNTTAIINDKIEIVQEIETMLSQRKFEQKVLGLLPVGMVLLLSLSAADYMEPVFTSMAGRITMSAAIITFAAANLISGKIMDIRL